MKSALELGGVAETIRAEAVPEDERRVRLAELLKHRIEGRDSWDLSYGQRALWYLHKLAPTSDAYNMNLTVKIRDWVDAPALERALQALVDAHESLRTRIIERAGRPCQQVEPKLAFQLREFDASALDAERLAGALASEAQAPFELERAPLFRAALYARRDESFLSLTVHHLIGDYWSFSLVLRALGELYQAERLGKSLELEAPSARYRDFVAWQKTLIAGPEGERQWRYWSRLLSGELPVLSLPHDRPRSAALAPAAAIHGFWIDATLLRELSVLGKAESATLFMVLLAAYQLLLGAWSAQSEVLVGAPVAGRPSAYSEVVGYFANMIAYRSQLTSALSFRDFVRQVRGTVLEALDHQDYPFSLLVERLRLARSSQGPIFQAAFMFERAQYAEAAGSVRLFGGEQGGELKLAGLTLEAAGAPRRAAQFELSLTLEQSGEALYGLFEFDADRFEPSTIERMREHFVTLLARAASTPDAPLGEVARATSRDLARLHGFNETASAFQAEVTVWELFESTARRVPEHACVYFGSCMYRYREVREAAIRCSALLEAAGVTPGARVAVCLERSPLLLVALLAVWSRGAAYVPLDPSYPNDRIEFVLEDAEVALTLTDAGTRSRLPRALERALELPESVLRDTGLPTRTTLAAQKPGGAAYVLYTSGSTGKPKGVVVEHASVVNLLLGINERIALGEGQKLFALSSIAFDISVLELFLPLCVGACVEIGGSGLLRDPQRLAEALDQSGADLVQATPSLYQVLLHAGFRGGRHLRLMSGGEALPLELAAALLERCRTLFNVYGPTETTIWSTLGEVRANERISIGRALPNQRVYVLNDARQPVPLGVPGELFIAGEGVAREYFRRPELTRERFLELELGGARERAYATGDVVRFLPSGELEYLGRRDDQLKIRGHRVEPGEVESALKQLSGVTDAAVVAIDDANSAKRLAAFVVGASGGADAGQLRRLLGERLPHYLVPDLIDFVDALPRTPNGKLDRSQLRKSAPAHGTTDRTPPRDELEQELLSLWQALLGVPALSVRDDFFELGGHSILAVELLARLERRFGRRLPLEFFARGISVERLAEVLREPERAASGIVALRNGSAGGASFFVHSAGGSALAFRDLARSFPGEGALYAFEPDAVVPSTIEQMARIYLDRALSLGSSSPLLLAGHSFGALVAYEMARELARRGLDRITLVLLDPMLPTDDVETLARRGAALFAAFGALGRFPPGGEAKPGAWLEQATALGFAHLELSRAYTLGAYAGRTYLVRPSGAGSPEPWASLCANLMEVKSGGDHFSMLRPEHLTSLFELLR